MLSVARRKPLTMIIFSFITTLAIGITLPTTSFAQEGNELFISDEQTPKEIENSTVIEDVGSSESNSDEIGQLDFTSNDLQIPENSESTDVSRENSQDTPDLEETCFPESSPESSTVSEEHVTTATTNQVVKDTSESIPTTTSKVDDTTPQTTISATTNVSDVPKPRTAVLVSNLDSNLVVDKSGGATSSSSNAQLYTYNGTQAQRLTFTWDSEGYATITLVDNTVLDVYAGKAVVGANVRWFKANGTDAQRWRVIDNTDGTVSLRSALNESLALDVKGAHKTKGANLWLYTINSTNAQRFHMTAQAPISTDETLNGKTFVISSAIDASKVLDVHGASRANGAHIQVYSANDTYAQAFRFESVGSGYYILRPHSSHQSVDVDNGAMVPHTKVQQWSYRGNNTNQWWSVQENTDGTYTFLAYSSSLALDLPGSMTTNGLQAQLYYPNGTKAQKWHLRLVGGIEQTDIVSLPSEGVYHIESALLPDSETTQLVVDVHAGSSVKGTNVQIYSDNSTVAQRFHLVLNKDNTVSFTNIQTGMALDVANASVWAGTNVQMYTSNSSAAQKWAVYVNSDGTYSFRSLASGLALSVTSRHTSANVETNLVTDSANQRFRLQHLADPRVIALELSTGALSSVRVIGDSITAGSGTTGYEILSDSPIVLKQEDQEGVKTYHASNGGSAYTTRLENYVREKGIDDFTNAGVPRKTMRDFAQYSSSWLGLNDGNKSADLVFVMLGTNDYNNSNLDEFTSNAKNALSAAAESSKLLVVISPPHDRSIPDQWKYISHVNDILRNICEDNGYIHVSLTTALDNTSYYADAVHPNDSGHEVIWKILEKQLCL